MRYLITFFFLTTSLSVASQKGSSTASGLYIDSIIKTNLKEWNIAGMSISIVQDGKVIYNKGFGFKDSEGAKSVTPSTIFAMGSSAKAFTGAMVAQADTDSIIKLSQPVSEQTPITFENNYLTENITFLDLLTHTTGIPGHDFVWLTQKLTRDELYERIRFLPSSTGLRQRFQYNNILFATAGYATAKLRNQTWEEAIKETLFTPLKMQSTSFSLPTENSADFSLSFVYNGTIYTPLPFRNLELIAPAGGVYTTSTDLSKWLKMLLNNGEFEGSQVLDEKTIKKMFHPYVVSVFPRRFEEHFYENYGLGWMITNYRGKLHIHHAGNIDGFTSTVDLWPEEDLGIAILTNTAYANNFTDVVKYEIVDHLLDFGDIAWKERYKGLSAKSSASTEPPKKEEIAEKYKEFSQKDLARYEGSYSHGAYGTIVFSGSGNSLTAMHGAFPLRFEPIEKNVFKEITVLKGQKFAFVEGEDDIFKSVKSIFPSSGVEIVFERN